MKELLIAGSVFLALGIGANAFACGSDSEHQHAYYDGQEGYHYTHIEHHETGGDSGHETDAHDHGRVDRDGTDGSHDHQMDHAGLADLRGTY